MFRLFRRKGTAIHTMDLVLLISAVGTAFAIARGPITKHLGGWIIASTQHILDLSDTNYGPVRDPNEDVQKASDARDLDDQVSGYTSEATFFNTYGEGDSVTLVGDYYDVLDPVIDEADLGGKYRGANHNLVGTARDSNVGHYTVPALDPLTIPKEATEDDDD